ncbi:hypothetical protein [Mesorhizobium sp. CAU 1732]|uniref:hypothetical protein n=1 Tax=Mesorhizobium sp. CAU 1732 TaxID=3140358 RepID=UPI0032612A29
MRYTAPPGGDLDAPYIDGNRNAGIKGSVVPAAAVEHPQRELDHLIAFSGQTPDRTDLEQVRKAIESLISAATGGGDTSKFLLVSQARARLPIFPEILSADGRMNVTSPAAGTVLVPPTVAFQHRGIFPMSTSDYSEAQRSFATVANKTYHLRWTLADGFVLRDLANAGYNPAVAAETNERFDSSYDDMLIARVTTNGSNVATITNLANRNALAFMQLIHGTDVKLGSQNGANFLVSHAFNWARTPKTVSLAASRVVSAEGGYDADIGIMPVGVDRNSALALASHPAAMPINRYQLNGVYLHDMAAAVTLLFSAGG